MIAEMEAPVSEAITRRDRTIVGRVRRYFEENPNEELTYANLRAKFGCTKWAARWIVRTLIDEGTHESVHVIRLRGKGIAKEET